MSSINKIRITIKKIRSYDNIFVLMINIKHILIPQEYIVKLNKKLITNNNISC